VFLKSEVMRNSHRIYSKIIERNSTTWGNIVAVDMLVQSRKKCRSFKLRILSILCQRMQKFKRQNNAKRKY
jgi:hypothetical protein